MVEGRGLRDWEEAVYLFQSEDYDSAFQRALAIGEGGQSGGEEGIQRPRWVETRLAEIMAIRSPMAMSMEFRGTAAGRAGARL